MEDRLRSAGHTGVAPDLPYDDPATTYAERAQPALDALVDADQPVIVVGHSLAAGCAPLVAAGIPEGRLVYLCPAPVGPFADSGAPTRPSREGFVFPRDRDDGTSVWDPEEAIAVMYRRLPGDTAKAIAACLRPGSSPADAYPLSEQPHVPTTFIYALHDEFFDPAWSTWVAREVAKVEPVALDTGHFPMVEAPDATAELLLELAA